LSIPGRLAQDHLRFLLATANGHSHGEAEQLFTHREQEWTTTPCSPLMTVDSMVELEPAGSDLLIHVVAQGQILRLDLQWNGNAYASLDNAALSEMNGWHVATFLVPAQDIEFPTTTSVENALHYELDTLQRSGLSFDASVVLEP